MVALVVHPDHVPDGVDGALDHGQGQAERGEPLGALVLASDPLVGCHVRPVDAFEQLFKVNAGTGGKAEKYRIFPKLRRLSRT